MPKTTMIILPETETRKPTSKQIKLSPRDHKSPVRPILKMNTLTRIFRHKPDALD